MFSTISRMLVGVFLTLAMPAWAQAVHAPVPSPISLAATVLESTTPPLSLLVGTPVVLQLKQRLKSGETKAGDKVLFGVTERVLLGQTVVIPVGTPAYGLVESASGAGAFGRAGTLRIRCDYILLPGGLRIPVQSQTPLSRSGRSETGTAESVGFMTGLTAGGLAYAGSDVNRNLFTSSPDRTTPTFIGLGTGVVVGALVGSLFRGGNVTLDEGERMEVTVARETALAESAR